MSLLAELRRRNVIRMAILHTGSRLNVAIGILLVVAVALLGFQDGISEEIPNVPARIPQLKVAARTSSYQFKEQNQAIGAIAAALGVDHVLEGSVRRAGDRVLTRQAAASDEREKTRLPPSTINMTTIPRATPIAPT